LAVIQFLTEIQEIVLFVTEEEIYPLYA